MDPEESQTLLETLENVIVSGNTEEIFNQCIDRYRINKLKERENRLLTLLSLADEENSTESARELTIELMEVQKEIKAHGGKDNVNRKN